MRKDKSQQHRREYKRNWQRKQGKRPREPKAEKTWTPKPNLGDLTVSQKFQDLTTMGVPWEKLPMGMAASFIGVIDDAEGVAAEEMVVAVRQQDFAGGYSRGAWISFLQKRMRWALLKAFRTEVGRCEQPLAGVGGMYQGGE
jgi:hypothetical protein